MPASVRYCSFQIRWLQRALADAQCDDDDDDDDVLDERGDFLKASTTTDNKALSSTSTSNRASSRSLLSNKPSITRGDVVTNYIHNYQHLLTLGP